MKKNIPVVLLTLFLSMGLSFSMWWASSHFYHIAAETSAIIIDGILLTPLGFLIFGFSRRLWLGSLILALLAVLLILGQPIKLSMLGTPIVWGDVYSIKALVDILHGWRLLLLLVPTLVFLAILCINWRLRPVMLAMAAVFLVPLFSMLYLAPASLVGFVDGHLPYVQWSRRTNLLRRGGILYFYESYARFVVKKPELPDQETIETIFSGDTGAAPPRERADKRNIYLFLLESFWDPTLLKNYRFSADPFHPDFRRLWQQTGNSTVLVPVFGGGTANSEFEVLCGLPLHQDTVAFVSTLVQNMPCLPRVLRGQGYYAVASHPNTPNFWGRMSGYDLLGFERYHAIADFDMDDMNGSFLSDGSFFRQSHGLIRTELDTRPNKLLFNYRVSLSSHYPYTLNPKNRVKVVHLTPEAPVLEQYSNSTYYTSKELVEEIHRIQAEDPDAVIAAFGDHLPVLGDGFALYAASGFLAPTLGKSSSEQLRHYNETPVLVIDGRKGPVSLGALPLFELPAYLLKLAGADSSDFPLSRLTEKYPDHPVIRPGALGILTLQDNQTYICRGQEMSSKRCKDAGSWGQILDRVRDDLSQGHQYVLETLGIKRELMQLRLERSSSLSKNGICLAELMDWGPKSVAKGSRFNAQPDGQSAFWFKFRKLSGNAQLYVGGKQLSLTRGPDFVSGTLPADELVNHPSRYPVFASCQPGTATVALGEFVVARAN